MRARTWLPVLPVLGLVLAMAVVTPAADAAGVRYAKPSGSGTACTAAVPCTLVEAVNNASTGDEVVLAPGTYTPGVQVKPTNNSVHIHATPGQPRPVVSVSSAGTAVAPVLQLDDLRRGDQPDRHGLGVVPVRLRQHGDPRHRPRDLRHRVLRGFRGVDAGRPVRRERRRDRLRPQLRRLRRHQHHEGAQPHRDRDRRRDGVRHLLLRQRLPHDDGRQELDPLRGDRRADRRLGGAQTTVTLATSNYDNVNTVAGGTVTPPGTATNQTAAPVFADTTLFHQATTSPTVDAGAADVDAGTTDLDGDARQLGKAVDIGADELVPPPDTTAPDTAFGKKPGKHTHSRKAKFTFTATEAATFLCSLDKKPATPCASPFKKRVKKAGKHTFSVAAVDAAGNVDPTAAVYKWRVRAKAPTTHRYAAIRTPSASRPAAWSGGRPRRSRGR